MPVRQDEAIGADNESGSTVTSADRLVAAVAAIGD
jgi:hypothetical protein